jgi:DNA-binding response OmpR family regulator
LDLNLANISGLDILKKIKSQNPEFSVIIINGIRDESKAKKAIRLGADDYLVKPFDFDILEEEFISRIFNG